MKNSISLFIVKYKIVLKIKKGKKHLRKLVELFNYITISEA